MKITFLGTGTSMGVPTAGGFGREESTGDPRDERLRCSAWIQTQNSSVVIDTGPEFRIQTIRSGLTHIDLVLLTHEHMDHIAGFDDLRPFNYIQDTEIPVYTSQTCINSLYKRFDYMFGEDRYPGAVTVDLQVIEEQTQFRDLTITPLPAQHGNCDVLGYRINDLVYLSDVKEIPEITKQRIKGAKMMVLSALRWEPEHTTHLTIPQAVELATESGIPMTYLIHMNSYVFHEEANTRLPDHVQLAYDQLTVNV